MLRLTSRSIFLFDASGAALSALFTLGALPYISEFTGLPNNLLSKLGCVPVVYCFYSSICYFVIKETKPVHLFCLILANLIYCAISGLVILAYDKLTLLGQALLILEILVILFVVAIEMKIYKSWKSQA